MRYAGQPLLKHWQWTRAPDRAEDAIIAAHQAAEQGSENGWLV
jgi:hypothetical protein